jgi:hypothetical protein
MPAQMASEQQWKHHHHQPFISTPVENQIKTFIQS